MGGRVDPGCDLLPSVYNLGIAASCQEVGNQFTRIMLST
jgi:hypothetical protein